MTKNPVIIEKGAKPTGVNPPPTPAKEDNLPEGLVQPKEANPKPTEPKPAKYQKPFFTGAVDIRVKDNSQINIETDDGSIIAVKVFRDFIMVENDHEKPKVVFHGCVDIWKLPLHGVSRVDHDTYVTRVAAGWIYYMKGKDGDSAVFVPWAVRPTVHS